MNSLLSEIPDHDEDQLVLQIRHLLLSRRQEIERLTAQLTVERARIGLLQAQLAAQQVELLQLRERVTPLCPPEESPTYRLPRSPPLLAAEACPEQEYSCKCRGQDRLITFQAIRAEGQVYLRVDQLQEIGFAITNLSQMVVEGRERYAGIPHRRWEGHTYVTVEDSRRLVELGAGRARRKWGRWTQEHYPLDEAIPTPTPDIPQRPGVYLIQLGTVADLREQLAIPDCYPDTSLVCKYGRSGDLRRRWKEHRRDYLRLGMQVQMLRMALYQPPEEETEAGVPVIDLTDDEITTTMGTLCDWERRIADWADDQGARHHYDHHRELAILDDDGLEEALALYRGLVAE